MLWFKDLLGNDLYYFYFPRFGKRSKLSIYIWGAGLVGSTYQMAAIYSQAATGLNFEAPKNAYDVKLPITFGWRGGNVAIKILDNYNLGIGTLTPTDKLSVNGTIRAQEIKVEVSNWPDYVFNKKYKLPTLKYTKEFIDRNGHLPDVPSATRVKESGVPLGQMNALLLKKIDELTLHLFELKKQKDADRIRSRKQNTFFRKQIKLLKENHK